MSSPPTWKLYIFIFIYSLFAVNNACDKWYVSHSWDWKWCDSFSMSTEILIILLLFCSLNMFVSHFFPSKLWVVASVSLWLKILLLFFHDCFLFILYSSILKRIVQIFVFNTIFLFFFCHFILLFFGGENVNYIALMFAMKYVLICWWLSNSDNK